MKHPRLELVLALGCLLAISGAVTALVQHFGWALYYGDAEAHLNIARRIVDSRTPGYDQIGTVWLPLPHVLMLPWIRDDALWRNGLAGAIPSSICFVLAGMFLFAAIRRATKSSAAAATSVGLFALNPNLLYLQATPMTEPVFFAGLMALLYFTVLFRDTQSLGAVVGAGISSVAAALSRYEGWFVIPFVALYFLVAARRRRIYVTILFSVIALSGPLYWLAHNYWLNNNALDFYNGPYSAKAIYQRALDQHMVRYPGDHDWRKAWLFFRTAASMCVGWGVVIVAAIGVLGAIFKRVFWPLLFTALPAIFYLWSMYGGNTPIFVPQLWYGSYYNTRYGLAALPLLAIAGGGLVLLAGPRFRAYTAMAVILAGIAPWLINPHPENWVCWKESQVNSEGRRGWTREAATFFARDYRPGQGIFTSFGDLSGAFREAGIPLREALHDGNEPAWMAATTFPALFLHEEWALAMAGDSVTTAIQRAWKTGPHYHLVRSIRIKGQPVIEIYRRD